MLKKFLRKTISLFCACRKCPSYPGKGDPVTYCEFGKSKLEIKKKGCICSKCFVWKVNRFSNYYYCETGKDPKSKI